MIVNQLVNNMKKVLIILLSILIVGGCGNKVKDELQTIIDENNYIIVDVRTQEEYDEGHIKDSLNIPYDTINENTELDKSKTILVYCRLGKRSSIAKSNLETLGYKVYNLGAYESIDKFEKVK